MYSVFHLEGGTGKNIVATNVVRNIKKTYPDRKLIVVSPYPEVFIQNPYIYRNYKIGVTPYFYEDFIKDQDTLVFKHEPYNSQGVLKREKSLAVSWCESLGLELEKIQPEIFFNRLEQQNANSIFNQIFKGKPVIAIQANGGLGHQQNSIPFNWYRDIPLVYAQEIVNIYSDRFTFVQIRRKDQPQLNNVAQIDLNMREVLMLLSRCAGAFCIDSFVQHAMAAFGKPSIVAWIGNSPTVYGYESHTNIISNLTFEEHNPESYLDAYPLQANGYQCPASYNPATLFNMEQFKTAFDTLYVSKLQAAPVAASCCNS